MIQNDEDDEFDRIKRENALREVQRLGQEIEGQPYHLEVEAIQAAIRIEREECAKLCEQHGNDNYCEHVSDRIAQKIRARGQG